MALRDEGPGRLMPSPVPLTEYEAQVYNRVYALMAPVHARLERQKKPCAQDVDEAAAWSPFRSSGASRRLKTFVRTCMNTERPRMPAGSAELNQIPAMTILTPYYEEECVANLREYLELQEDGTCKLDLLREVYPSEFENLLERFDVVYLSPLRRLFQQHHNAKGKDGEGAHSGREGADGVRGKGMHSRWRSGPRGEPARCPSLSDLLKKEGGGVPGGWATEILTGGARVPEGPSTRPQTPARSASTTGLGLRSRAQQEPPTGTATLKAVPTLPSGLSISAAQMPSGSGPSSSSSSGGAQSGSSDDQAAPPSASAMLPRPFHVRPRSLSKGLCDRFPSSDGLPSLVSQTLRGDEVGGLTTITSQQEAVSRVEARFREELTLWVSHRQQSLARTVRGMMRSEEALAMLCWVLGRDSKTLWDVDMEPPLVAQLWRKEESVSEALSERKHKEEWQKDSRAQNFAKARFLYVVAAQKLDDDIQRESTNAAAAHRVEGCKSLLKRYSNLRMASVRRRPEGVHSVLWRWRPETDDREGGLESEYQIPLPRLPPPYPIVGEGKPENQNLAMPFTRGDVVQACDMNMDHYLEQALSLPCILQEFRKKSEMEKDTNKRGEHGQVAIVGFPEHVFTHNVSFLAHAFALQERTFVTFFQSGFDWPLNIRMHYGHPDLFDRMVVTSNGSMSKASLGLNLSEDIFAGFNLTQRGMRIKHVDYFVMGKGRDYTLEQISIFEKKISRGAGEQLLSRDLWRQFANMDFFRAMSLFYTSVGGYVYSLVLVGATYLVIYVQLMLSVENMIFEDSKTTPEKLAGPRPFEGLFALALLAYLPMAPVVFLRWYETGSAVKGIAEALRTFFAGGALFFNFSIMTRAQAFDQTILTGGAAYEATGRGIVLSHISFWKHWSLFAFSHLEAGAELLLLLIIYCLIEDEKYMRVFSIPIWLQCVGLLLSPFLFNPLGFERKKVLQDFREWIQWTSQRTLSTNFRDSKEEPKSWRDWWLREMASKDKTPTLNRIFIFVRSCRFFIVTRTLLRLGLHYSPYWKQKRRLLICPVLLVILVVLRSKAVVLQRRRLTAVLTSIQACFLLGGFIFIGGLGLNPVSDLCIIVLVAANLLWWLIYNLTHVIPNAGTWELTMNLVKNWHLVMASFLFLALFGLSMVPGLPQLQTSILWGARFAEILRSATLQKEVSVRDSKVSALEAKAEASRRKNEGSKNV